MGPVIFGSSRSSLRDRSDSRGCCCSRCYQRWPAAPSRLTWHRPITPRSGRNRSIRPRSPRELVAWPRGDSPSGGQRGWHPTTHTLRPVCAVVPIPETCRAASVVVVRAAADRVVIGVVTHPYPSQEPGDRWSHRPVITDHRGTRPIPEGSQAVPGLFAIAVRAFCRCPITDRSPIRSVVRSPIRSLIRSVVRSVVCR